MQRCVIEERAANVEDVVLVSGLLIASEWNEAAAAEEEINILSQPLVGVPVRMFFHLGILWISSKQTQSLRRSSKRSSVKNNSLLRYLRRTAAPGDH